MQDYNRSHRYRNDNRSSSYERDNDNNWNRTYNRSDDWGGYNTENRDTQASDRERGYGTNSNQMNRNYYNDNYSNRDSYSNDYNRNRNDRDDYFMNDYNRWNSYNNDYMNQNRYTNNDYNRNFRGDSYTGNDYMHSNRRDWNDYNERYRNEGWRDNNRNEDRNWWDKTKDEVASWFGDDDAGRRRQRDERYSGQHRGKGPKNYTRSQERIKEDVSDKLSDDSFLDASDIDVEVNGNEVTLNGHVDSRYSKHRAEDLAEDVTGVTHVQNNLRVTENITQTPGSSMNTGSKNTNTGTGTNYNTTKNRKEHVTL